MTFEEIMSYHIDNRIVYEKIKTKTINKTIVPFIGAGLSAKFYPLWKPFLEKLADTYISEPLIKDNIKTLLEQSDYEEAAEKMHEAMGDFLFFTRLRESFDVAKIDDSHLKNQAVNLIPILFRQLVLTTNFDLVLERAFLLNQRALTVGYPDDTHAFRRSLHAGEGNMLFKFHGDVNKNWDFPSLA